MTPIEQELGKEISKAVEQIVAASHAAAMQALDAAFHRGSPTRAVSSSRQNTASPQTTRRSSEQIQVLKDSVYQALCSSPGQTMSALAEQVGSTTRQLQVPIARLKAEDLIRSAGKRPSVRYFPRNGGAQATSACE